MWGCYTPTPPNFGLGLTRPYCAAGFYNRFAERREYPEAIPTLIIIGSARG